MKAEAARPLKSTQPPWHFNPEPSYERSTKRHLPAAAILVWIIWYQALVESPAACGGRCMSAAAVLTCALLYYAPAILGMKTGFPLHIVGSSTFGTTGSYLLPGLLMSGLQIGWFSVGAWVATNFVLAGVGVNHEPGTPVFIGVAVLWAYAMMQLGRKRIRYLSKLSLWVSAVAALLILVLAVRHVDIQIPSELLLSLHVVIGFILSATAVALEFGVHRRDEPEQPDIKSGIIGIALSMLPLLIVGIAITLSGSFNSALSLPIAIALVPAATLCALLIRLSLWVMIPGIPIKSSMFAAVLAAVVLAATGATANLITVFGIIAAAFGPAWGAMTADFLISGRRWRGPREGINIPGCLAWGLGFCVGIVPLLPVSYALKAAVQPAAVYSFVTGFIMYVLLAKVGLQSSFKPI